MLCVPKLFLFPAYIPQPPLTGDVLWPILTLGAHSCRECSRCIPTRAEHREVITFLHLLAVLPLTQPRMLLACCIPRASRWLMLSLLSAKAWAPSDRAALQPASLWPALLKTPKIFWYQVYGDGQDTFPMPHTAEAPRFSKIIYNKSQNWLHIDIKRK